jgi:hypothetical protein
MPQLITYRNGFKIIHDFPEMTEEEVEKKNEEILLKLYNLFCNDKNY